MKSLKDLGALKAELDRQSRAASAEFARQRAEAQRQAREQRLFQLTVGVVHPMKDRGLANVPRTPPPPLPRQRVLDEQAALREALSDEVDVDSLLDTDDTLSFRRPDIGPDVLLRLRRGQWAVQAQVDLHGLTRDEAREHLAQFVRESMQLGLRCVRIVHGKGHGSPGRTPVLKSRVQAWLVQKNEVAAFTQARGPQGGAGALIVLLRG